MGVVDNHVPECNMFILHQRRHKEKQHKTNLKRKNAIKHAIHAPIKCTSHTNTLHHAIIIILLLATCAGLLQGKHMQTHLR